MTIAAWVTQWVQQQDEELIGASQEPEESAPLPLADYEERRQAGLAALQRQQELFEAMIQRQQEQAREANAFYTQIYEQTRQAVLDCTQCLAPRQPVIRHPVLPPDGTLDGVPALPSDLSFSVCETRYPAQVCTCGRYGLSW